MSAASARFARAALGAWLACVALTPAPAKAQSTPSTVSTPSTPSTVPSASSSASPSTNRPAPGPAAPPSPARLEQAREHFRRGVAAYKRNDYRTALVEFRRSSDITADARVLFNLGETHWQLHDYGEAMNAFTRYLERGESIPAARRSALEQRIATLHERVGRVELRAEGGATLSIDDGPLGLAPLAEPFFVSAGRHKFAASPGVSRTVDVAGGDELNVDLSPAPAPVAAAVSPPPSAPAPVRPNEPPPPSTTLAWGMTGAAVALGAGAALMGAIAIGAKHDYDHAVETFPADYDEILAARSRTRLFGTTADVLGVAAVGTGTFAAYLWLSRPRPPAAGATTWGLQIGGPALVLRAQF